MIHVFIINHYAGQSILSRTIRKHLETRKDIKYFVFNTVKAGYETEIVKKLHRYFADEKLRFYCCGGSGTMRNMINGFEEGDLQNVEVAFFPCGLTNDFLKTFDNQELFKDLDKLIDGEAVKIDYIRTNNGIALNTLSVGFDSNIEKVMQSVRIYDVFHAMIPYFIAVIKGIVFAKKREIELVIDGHKSSKKYVEVVYGNGAVLGGNLFFTERANVQDGKASFLMVHDVNALESIGILSKIMNKRLTKIKKKVNYGQCESIEIRRKDGKHVLVNFDGELVDCGTLCHAHIVKKGINFVIPEGVTLKDYVLE